MPEPHPLIEPPTSIQAPRSASPADPLSQVTRHRGWQVLLSLASVVAGLVLTLASATVQARVPFVFCYAPVAFGAAVGGFWLGLGVTIVSALTCAIIVLSPTHRLAGLTPPEITAIVAFVLVAILISAIAEVGRRSRARADENVRRMREATAELEAQQEEAQLLAEELEQVTTELEAAIGDATRARDNAETGERQLRLLDDASRVLASSLDYEVTIVAAAQLAVPDFADWCGVDLVVEGRIEPLAVAHVDPEKVRWARELNAKYPTLPDAPLGVPEVIRTGKSQLVPVITEDVVQAAARDAGHLAIIRELGVQSAMIVPMAARGKTLGAMTLISVNPKRHFDQHDLSVAQEFARRAAIAIDNAQLYRAALAANEAKSNFLATMSHELRTPLTAIIGYQELLAEGITGPVTRPQAQQLQRIKVSAMHLLGLIEEILSYSRLEAGRESVHVEPVAVKGIMDDAMAFVMPLAEGRPIKLAAAPCSPGLMMRTDPGKLRQILVNLLSNAVKFTPKGSVMLGVDVHNPDITFTVSDTGIGIATEHLDHIFDPFWQVEQHMTRTAGGSGLGLSVARRLARARGGDITVESAPGKGSAFTVRLPLASKSTAVAAS